MAGDAAGPRAARKIHVDAAKTTPTRSPVNATSRSSERRPAGQGTVGPRSRIHGGLPRVERPSATADHPTTTRTPAAARTTQEPRAVTSQTRARTEPASATVSSVVVIHSVAT